MYLVTSCEDLTCEENEICVSAGDSYQCVCHPDYEGENCQAKGRYDSIIYIFTDSNLEALIKMKARPNVKMKLIKSN
jgi:hypothetical protein